MKKDIILRFINAINNQDMPVIMAMMSEDFVFIDTYGGIESKKAMETGWPGYFAWFPDYRIEVDDYIDNESFAVVLGRASGSYLGKKDRHWDFPAAWKVAVKQEQISLWQVFCDSKKQLDSMN